MKILIIRRDNIGDLVCTTPLIRSLRKQLPLAYIGVLATRYNQAVLHNNPDINALDFYTKAKHRSPEESVFQIYWRRLITIFKLRQQHFDVILIPGGSSASALRFARWVKARQIITQDDCLAGEHEVERCCYLLTQMGLNYEAPAPLVNPDPREISRFKDSLRRFGRQKFLIGIHISARKLSQRWPVDRFISLMQRLHEERPAAVFVLLWSPGSQDNPLHPGDDEKAQTILDATNGLPVHPVPTNLLGELIAILSLCDMVFCSDGGAMHLAAGLGKSIVALFGQSSVERWHPWKVPQVVLQKPRKEVSDISVQDVVDAFRQLNAQA